MYTSSMKDRALIITRDAEMEKVLQQVLWDADWEVTVWDHRQMSAEEDIHSQWLLIIVSAEAVDHDIRKALEGLRTKAAPRRPTVLILSEQSSISQALQWTEFGAIEYLRWPVLPERIIEIAEYARNQQVSEEQIHSSASSPEPYAAKNKTAPMMIGRSRSMIELAKNVVRIAQAPGMRAFINGETGTGKEVIARMIHEFSPYSGPFRAVNCAATVEGLLESDLFGHERGAFTGAHATKRGFWEEAANGTLFLDEITEASLNVQAKLLRALQEGVIRRVGSNTEIKVTARVIAASNQNIDKAIKEGRFRQDLFYRLGFVLEIPPLRERPEDIPLLVEHFARRFQERAVITPEAMAVLCDYEWPGNVRELESVIQTILALTGRIVLREDVLARLRRGETREETTLHYFRGVWGALPKIKPGGWPTILELRDWYVQQVYYYLGRESAVARHVGLDIRTVNAILRKEDAWKNAGKQLPPEAP